MVGRKCEIRLCPCSSHDCILLVGWIPSIRVSDNGYTLADIHGHHLVLQGAVKAEMGILRYERRNTLQTGVLPDHDTVGDRVCERDGYFRRKCRGNPVELIYHV